jgi:hypothetical protein
MTVVYVGTDHRQIAAELLDKAQEQERGNPSNASTLALIGIGNALLHVGEELMRLQDLNTMVGSLDEIAHKPFYDSRGSSSWR